MFLAYFFAATISSCEKLNDGSSDNDGRPERVKIPDNEIWYTTTNSEKLDLTYNTSKFIENPIISNTYKDGKGVITFQEALTCIPEQGFVNRNRLKTIILPDCVRSLECETFAGCNYLLNIQLSENLESIGQEALCSSSRMDSLFIPAKVSYIANDALSNTNNLKYLVVDKQNKFFDSRENCNALIETASNTLLRGSSHSTIPSTVTSLGDYAFSMADFKSLDIPENISSIGVSAFEYCLLLEEIRLPENLTVISGLAFNSCEKLKEIQIPEKVTKIGGGAFGNCRSINKITIPETIIEIGQGAFYFCTELTEAVLPEKLTTIPDALFKDCWNLSRVNIPQNITSIGKEAFYCCNKLSDITLPESVTEIKSGAFYKTDIRTITIPSKVREISDNSFRSCNSLENIFLPEGLKSIQNDAISSEAMTEIVIPSTIENFGVAALAGSNLTSIYIKATTPPQTVLWLFLRTETIENKKIYVPSQSVETYKTSEFWKTYESMIKGYDF